MYQYCRRSGALLLTLKLPRHGSIVSKDPLSSATKKPRNHLVPIPNSLLVSVTLSIGLVGACVRANPGDATRVSRGQIVLIDTAHLPIRFCPQKNKNMPPKKTVEKKSGGKKPLSGYMKFAQERRPTLKEEQPDLTFGEVRGMDTIIPPCEHPA